MSTVERIARRLKASALKRVHRFLPALSLYLDRRELFYGAILLTEPLIILPIFGGSRRPLRAVRGMSSLLRARRVTFLLSPGWTLETSGQMERLAAAILDYRAEFPQHELIFLCNTPVEESLLSAVGERALLVNYNVFVPEAAFRPIDRWPVDYDAIYNAKLDSWKRHELASAVERVLYITYYNPAFMSRTDARRRIRSLIARGPNHTVANPIHDGLPLLLAPEAVNEQYNRAAVGLCLSAEEGQMRASMEYLLAGLPIVTTPSIGGRDVFFDPDYCVTAEADPRAIRDAVAALRARNIPRGYIRERTLEKIEPHRRRLLALLDSILESHGAEERFGAAWPYSDRSPFVLRQPVNVVAREFMRP